MSKEKVAIEKDFHSRLKKMFGLKCVKLREIVEQTIS